MSATPTESSGRLRFSISNLLLAFVIVGLGLVAFLQWREIAQLRVELNGYRQQLGLLNIDNPARAYATRVRQPDPNLWRWRVYLPPGRSYRLVSVEGEIPIRSVSPRRANKDNATWIAEVNHAPSVARSEHTGRELSGEFSVDMSLFHYEDRWRIVVNPGNDVTELPPSFIGGDWLDPASRGDSDEGLVDHQREYTDREPIVLLQLEKPIVSPVPGGGTKFSSPTVPAPGVVLWLEPK